MTNIRFYKTKGEHGCFSNFSKHPFKLKGHIWPTSEHYYQAQKFAGTEHENEIRLAKSAWVAAKQGRERHRQLRKDWESIKEQVMYDALKAKFTQNEHCKEVLLSTGDMKIVEENSTDYYWGEGANGKVKNRLGILLMRLRDELKNEDRKTT